MKKLYIRKCVYQRFEMVKNMIVFMYVYVTCSFRYSIIQDNNILDIIKKKEKKRRTKANKIYLFYFL